jgi:hypothetical protein
MACPGSINLSRGLPTYSTEYSREGTAAHNLMEKALLSRTKLEPADYVGEMMSDGEGGEVEVTEEMAEAVKMFTDHARTRWGEGTPIGVEAKFNLAPLGPPEDMFGTTDHWAYDGETRTLFIDDYKHGQGVVKEAIENEQLMYYGVGGLLVLGNRYPVDRVVLTIVQPRAYHPDGPIRSWSTTPAELLDFVGLLFDAARATQDPAAPLVPGEHCRFCPAAGVCPAKKIEAQALAQIEFETLPEFGPPAPATLPVEVLADMATKFHILKDWMKQSEALIEAKLRSGEEVPGFKLVERRKTRRWVDPSATEQFLKEEGYSPDEYNETPELKSPAQIEKLVGKKNLPKDLVVAKSSGYTLAKEGDARPAVALNPGVEFPALMPGSDDNSQE